MNIMAPSEPAVSLTQEIVRLCSPEEIWLYSRKLDLNGSTTSFKLCIVTREPDKGALEERIYLSLDCPVPYDLTVYTLAEWEMACQNSHSFAQTIRTKGQKLYGKTA